MSSSTEVPRASRTGTSHLTVNITPSQQTKTPEERHADGEAQQDSTTTPCDLQCAACDDQVSPVSTWQAPCQHIYCTDCLERFFRLSLEDEMLYPPRCCKRIMPWGDVKVLVSHELASDFEGKKEELETRDRTYCSDLACSAFIGPDHVAPDASTATCPACKKLTCATCKSAFHAGDCPSDPAVQATLALAEKEEWQRCQECGRMIELTEGCNHITCPCGHHFCYTCGLRWYTCECEEEPFDFEDVRQEIMNDPVLQGLLQIGNDMPIHEMIARIYALIGNEEDDILDDAEPPPARQIEDRNDVAEAVPAHVPVPQLDHLDRNHQGWRFVHGAGHCQHCGEDMRVFLMECVTCQIRVCRRCTLHWL